jgi:hypothetical protein
MSGVLKEWRHSDVHRIVLSRPMTGGEISAQQFRQNRRPFVDAFAASKAGLCTKAVSNGR